MLEDLLRNRHAAAFGVIFENRSGAYYRVPASPLGFKGGANNYVSTGSAENRAKCGGRADLSNGL